MDLIEGFAKIRVYDVCLYTSVKVFLQIFNKAYEISFDRSSWIHVALVLFVFLQDIEDEDIP